LSGLAITALIISVLGAAGITGMFIASRLSGKPAYQPLLLLPVLIGLALAITARWQIRSSEGARGGIRFANSAGWIAFLFGVIYLTHIVVIEFAIRDQARSFTTAWIKGRLRADRSGVSRRTHTGQRASIDRNIAYIGQRFGGNYTRSSQRDHPNARRAGEGMN
jgi:hypothetical protein